MQGWPKAASSSAMGPTTAALGCPQRLIGFETCCNAAKNGKRSPLQLGNPGNVGFILAGQMEIGIDDGTTRRFGPGDVVLADDLTGQGHTTRSLGVPRISATAAVGA
jgi:hypothetical protein